MTLAICYKCGAKKTYAISMCPVCKIAPREDDALSKSWLLTDNMHSVDQLSKFADDIKANRNICFNADLEQKARTIVNNMRTRTKPTATIQQKLPPVSPTPPPLEPAKPSIITNQPGKTALHLSAFNLLGASTRDDRRRIVELADEKSLQLDSETCSKARADLTNPRSRLSAELAWLPGISPRRANELMNILQTNAEQLRSLSEIPSLAYANLLSASIELLDPKMDVSVWIDWIISLAVTVDNIKADVVLRDINEDRQISSFPEIKSIEIIESELAERRSQYRLAIKAALNKLQTVKLVYVTTEVVERATHSGLKHAPLLLDDMIDDYEVGFHAFLQKEAEAIYSLVDGVRDAAPKGVGIVRPLVSRIDEVIRKWDRVAQPIQLSMKSRGLEHELSNEVAFRLRSLSIDLYKQHDMLEISEKLTETASDVFAEQQEFKQKIDEDSAFIRLQKESDSIQELLKNARASAHNGEDAVEQFIVRIEEAVREWRDLLPEIDRKTESSNLSGKFSRDLAFNIRSFGIELFNEHGMLELAGRITKLLQEAFDELPEVSERLEEDAAAIEGIVNNRRQSEAERQKWEQEITYKAELGVLFKDTLQISPRGVAWKDTNYALEVITRVRWGGIRHSVNGIPTGTTYTIAFGDNYSEAIVSLRQSDVYEKFIDKLWRAVCARLMTDLAKGLKAGNSYNFGDAIIDDAGVKLTKHKFFSNETVYHPWGQARISSSSGSFFIHAADDNKTYSSMSYIETPNVHVLEALIRMSFKAWKGKISGILDG